jgi:hypothetical protein
MLASTQIFTLNCVEFGRMQSLRTSDSQATRICGVICFGSLMSLAKPGEAAKAITIVNSPTRSIVVSRPQLPARLSNLLRGALARRVFNRSTAVVFRFRESWRSARRRPNLPP